MKGGRTFNIQHSTSNTERSGVRANWTFEVGGWVLNVRKANCLAWIALVLCTPACRQDMFDQPKSKPLAESDFFDDRAMSRPIPLHTVARGRLAEDEAFHSGMIGTNLIVEFPIQITGAVLERGRERYDIYCAVCHGRTGAGNGIIVQRGFPAPPSYHIERLRAAPVGHYYDVMTRGYGVMYSYSTRVEPTDRWAITAYIRALQLSQRASLEDVPADERPQLEVKQP